MARRVRLRFHHVEQGAVWYHVEASLSHVLIDPRAEARAAASGFVRPIELWRAPRWQRPPSVAVIRYTDPAGTAHRDAGHSDAGQLNGVGSDVPPAIGDVVNLASVVDFISDASAFRLGTLGALLDATAAAMDGGPPVVLAAASADEGALWIGTISFLAPPETCLRLSFSTHERLDDAPDNPSGEWRTPVISVVPETDVDRLTGRDDLAVVMIDPRVEATLTDVAGVEHRRTHLGQQIAVTDWSRLAVGVCCEGPAVLERCLRRLDEVARARQVTDPAWLLAAAVAVTGDLPIALPGATRVIGRGAPGSPSPSASQQEPQPASRANENASAGTSLVTAAEHQRGAVPGDHQRKTAPEDDGQGAAPEDDARTTVPEDGADLAWARLRAALVAEPVRNGAVQAALESYLRAALSQDSWLIRQVPPLPANVPPDPALAARLQAPLAGLVERLIQGLGGDHPESDVVQDPASELAEDVRQGLLLLRGLDLAHRIARAVGGPDLSRVGLGRLAARAAEVLADDVVGPRVAAIAGPLDGAAIAQWLLPPLSQPDEPWLSSTGPVGDRLPAPVLALLARGVEPGEPAGPVALEVAVATAHGRIAGDPRLRGPAVEYLLHQAVEAYPDADPGPMVAEVFGRLRDGEPWTADALLRIVERVPAALGSELIPIVLGKLPDWIDDPLAGRLAAALLKRIEFLPRRGGDGKVRARRGRTTDGQAQLLNLLATTGNGWLEQDDGLHRRAAEILMWGDRAWTDADQEVRRLIAPRITVAAFQVALAAEPAQAATALRSRIDVVPVGSGWRSAVEIGQEQALGLLSQVLRLNRYRLAGELVMASTRAMLAPVPHDGDLPRLPMLPVGPVIRRLVEHEDRPELKEHLAALVDQELTLHAGPADRAGLVIFWELALPGTSITAGDPRRFQVPDPILDEVLQVALGLDHPGRRSGLSGLLALATRDPADRSRVPWWRRWVAR